MKYYVDCHNCLCDSEILIGPCESYEEAEQVGREYVQGNVSTHGFDILPCYEEGETVDIDD